MDGGPNHPIKWWTYREGVRSQLPKFESLPQDGLRLMQSYQAVLDNDETFTQYFSDEPLESYTVETRLRQTLGIHPPSSSDSGPSRSENDASISWVNIFRHGSFEKQSDGSYYCYDQGNLVQIDESLHKASFSTDASSRQTPTCGQVPLTPRGSPVRRKPPGAQYPTPNESRRLTISVKAHDTRARSSSESSGVSSGSDIPFTIPVSKEVSLDSDSDDHDAVFDNPRQQENSNPTNLIADSNQKPFDNKMGVSVSGLLSNRKPEVAQSRDGTQQFKQFQGDMSAKHQLHGSSDLMRPPPKKKKIEAAPSPTNIETNDLGEELPMWKEKVDTPIKPEPSSSTTGTRRKGQKRTRNNFTDYEKQHAPAWFKKQLDAGIPAADVEKAYHKKFGVFHRWLTLKLWVDRLEERAAKAKPPSKIVVLKVQLPLHLHLAFLNDNPS
ncbi:hypothetical protein HAV15_000538 [Penicillium sp. str. |nr:hypothetical protein HAV15_000538 [Penicillium sp. str. \